MPFPSRDVYELKNEADILYRASRPQRHSKYIPQKRDWRYETGVYQHEDFESEKEETIWDKLDADVLTGTFGKERRKVNKTTKGGGKRKRVTGLETPESAESSPLTKKGGGWKNSPLRKEYVLSEEGEAQGNDMLATPALTIGPSSADASPGEDVELTTQGVKRKLFDKGKPCSRCGERGLKCTTRPRAEKCDTCRKNGHVCVREDAEITTFPTQRGSTPNVIAAFEDGKQTCLKVLFRLGRSKLEALEEQAQLSPAPITSQTPTSSENQVEKTPQQNMPAREWVDETIYFNMQEVYLAVQDPEAKAKLPSPGEPWFREAAPVDAMFPPGLAMTMTEILAFYPHHILWDGVHERLVNSGYQTADIHGLQAWFRGLRSDEHPVPLADLKTIRQSIQEEARLHPAIDDEGKTTCSRRDQYTDFLRPSQHIAKRKFTVPTLDDLVAGLKHLPPDGRVLTQCVDWYLKNKNSFHTPLDLNVLHVQSLYRALRIPLVPLKIDMKQQDHVSLADWQGGKGSFGEKPVEMAKDVSPKQEKCLRAKPSDALEYSMTADGKSVNDVRLHTNLGVRFLLMAPALSMVSSLVGAFQAMEEKMDS